MFLGDEAATADSEGLNPSSSSKTAKANFLSVHMKLRFQFPRSLDTV